MTSRTVRVLIVALILTALSSLLQRERPEVQDWDCPPLPDDCARPVLVAGFPLPYISDYHGLSPVGSVDLIGALLGLDLFHPLPFFADLGIFGLLTAGARTVWCRVRR